MKDMPILERRRIEAQILKHVHDVVTERSGVEEADAVIGTAVSRSAIDQGRSFADALGHTPSLKDFADIMPLWTKVTYTTPFASLAIEAIWPTFMTAPLSSPSVRAMRPPLRSCAALRSSAAASSDWKIDLMRVVA